MISSARFEKETKGNSEMAYFQATKTIPVHGQDISIWTQLSDMQSQCLSYYFSWL